MNWSFCVILVFDLKFIQSLLIIENTRINGITPILKKSKISLAFVLVHQSVTNNTMVNAIKRSFALNLFILETFYLCPSKKQTFSYKLQSYVSYVLIIILVPVVSTLHLLLAEDLDLDRVIYNAGFIVQGHYKIL